MRRITRPARPIDCLISCPSLSRPRIPSSSCRIAFTSHSRLPPTTATFTTSPQHNGFLDGRKDRRKDQAFVRKWQKRLLGDSEPIGSRVDPYDPNSPIRVANEELGDEVEVLDDKSEDKEVVDSYEYEEAITWHIRKANGRTGKLETIGGTEWAQKFEEWMAVEDYNNWRDRIEGKLDIGKSMEEAKEEVIEDMMEEGTWEGEPKDPPVYWVADEDAFAPSDKLTGEGPLYAAFRRAVVETYILQESDHNPSLMAYPRLEDNVSAIDSVRLQTTQNGDMQLIYTPEAMDETLMDILPAEKHTEAVEEAQKAESELDADEADGSPEIVEAVTESTVDPVVEPKVEASKTPKAPVKAKPFDFMSNRPVPRSEQAEEQAPEAETATSIVDAESAPSPTAELEASAIASSEAVAEMRTAVRDAVERLAATSITVQKPTDLAPAEQDPATKEHNERKLFNQIVPTIDIKFAISKRLIQLTGHRISDPLLNSSYTLGSLFTSLLQTSKPPLKTTHSQIISSPTLSRLTTLPNVTLHKKRLSPLDKEKPLGRFKVIEYALKERKLPLYGSSDKTEDFLRKTRYTSVLWKQHEDLLEKVSKEKLTLEEVEEMKEREEQEKWERVQKKEEKKRVRAILRRKERGEVIGEEEREWFRSVTGY